jgi:hypothetical protein
VRALTAITKVAQVTDLNPVQHGIVLLVVPFHGRLAQRKSVVLQTEGRDIVILSTYHHRVFSLVAERSCDIREAAGSSPARRTNQRKRVREAAAAADNRVVGGAVPPACTNQGVITMSIDDKPVLGPVTRGAKGPGF